MNLKIKIKIDKNINKYVKLVKKNLQNYIIKLFFINLVKIIF